MVSLTTNHCDYVTGATTEVASLKKALSKAEDKAALECKEREKQDARVGEVQQELQELGKKFESLERDSKTQGSEFAKALENAQNAKAEAQKALQEIEAVKKIAAGKAFIMQSKHVKETFLLLTRVWSSPGAFADLPRSVLDATEFYRAEEGSSTEKLFWSQYTGTEHPVPLSGQLKQLVELHRVAELAMKDLIIRLWPAEAMPDSYFGLVRRMVNACPRLDVVKRSACIEGARMAFARCKMWWAKMDAVKLTRGPPEGKEHRTPERYFADVLEGSRIVATQFSRDIIFE